MYVNLGTGGAFTKGTQDPRWTIKKPGGNYGPVFISDGRAPAWAPQGTTFQDIYPNNNTELNVLAPFLHSNGEISDFPVGTPTGKYTYRLQFFFDTCNVVTSASISLYLLSGAGISKFLVNGYPKTLPPYSTSPSPTNFLRLQDAWLNRPTTSNPTPIFPTHVINLNSGDIKKGINSIFVEIDPSLYPYGVPGDQTAALFMLGQLEINYNLPTNIVPFINLSASPTFICNGSSGFLNVNLSMLPNFANYNLSVYPASYFAQAAANQQIPINPTTTTNYALTLRNTAGCATTVYHQVIRPVVPTVSGTAYICAGGFGNISVNGLTSPQVKIVASNPTQGRGVTIFNGTLNGALIVNPSVTTDYTIYVTDSYGCITTLTFRINVLPQPCSLRPVIETGIGDNEAVLDNVSVSPNPSTGYFKITSSSAGTAEIFGPLGNKLKSFEMNGESSEYEFDLTGFPKGIYLLNIHSNDKKITKRIVLE